MATLLAILQWAIPSGGIGAAIAWIANRKVAQAKAQKEVHDTYKSMYTDISEELIKVQKRNDEIGNKLEKLSSESAALKRALNRLTRAIEAIQLCPHRATCPVSNQLSLDEDGGGDVATSGQHGRSKDGGGSDSRRKHPDDVAASGAGVAAG